ncbi:hypothetical protein [Polaromonas jejuensis]|uniref:Uncharacterized protein n=1 Tax=Polaromonas jejuensis TaxID=457502 RepID=A0ABW0Q898_9BURK|nr:hypothetical protein [Polaromonas jejuensis]
MPAYIMGYKGFGIHATVLTVGSRFAGSVRIDRQGTADGHRFTPEWTDFPESAAEAVGRLQLHAKAIIDGRVTGKSVERLSDLMGGDTVMDWDTATTTY